MNTLIIYDAWTDYELSVDVSLCVRKILFTYEKQQDTEDSFLECESMNRFSSGSERAYREKTVSKLRELPK